MTDGTDLSAADDSKPAPPPPPPVTPDPSADSADSLAPIPLEQPPRPGDMTVMWRLLLATAWIGVAAALAAVWNASVQLGLATWWLGPRSDPQPLAVRLLPFLPTVVILMGAINNVRRLPIIGLAGAAAIAVVGLIDLGYVQGLALVELAIAAAAAMASAASFSGTYRAGAADSDLTDA